MGFTLFYLCLIVLFPLLTIPALGASLGWQRFWDAATDPRVMASYGVTLGASLAARSSTRCSARWWHGCSNATPSRDGA
jgi:ABC-type sulfate transport system permease component